MPKALAALAVLFLLAHLFYLPPTLEDIDSVNFALGVRDFDVARHQPHPPGYPVFIALGKASTAVMRALPVQSPESKALALPGVIAGALLIPLLFGLFRRFAEDEAVRVVGDGRGRLFAAVLVHRAPAPERHDRPGGCCRLAVAGALGVGW